MSSRKENICNKPGPSRHLFVGQNDRPRSRCVPINLNSTFANAQPTNHKLKAETTSTFSHTPSVDYDLQFDLAESNYMQALLFQKCMSRQMEKHTLSLNDQLSKYTEILAKKLEIMTELEDRIEEHDVHIMLQTLKDHLEDKLEKNLKELSPEVVFGFIKILKKIKCACNHLYLDKVKAPESQREYDKLQILMGKSEKILMKIINSSSDIDKYQKLDDCLTQFKNLETEITVADNSVKISQGDVNKLTLDTVSDILFNVDINKNDL